MIPATVASSPLNQANVEPDQFHLVFGLHELTAIVSALRSNHPLELADGIDNVLRQPGRAATHDWHAALDPIG